VLTWLKHLSKRSALLGTMLPGDDWSHLRPATVLYVCHDADRTVDIEGRRYAPIIDTIQDALSAHGISGLTVSSPYSVLTGARAYGTVVRLNRSWARGAVLDRGRALRRRTVDTWARVLDIVNPRGVIAVQPSRELCVAARRRGIWTADAQHGWIPSGEVPNEPYYTPRYWLPGIPLPDHFLVWDEASAANLRQMFAGRAIEPVVIGNQWCQRFQRHDPNDPIVRQWPVQRSVDPAILITLQWKTVRVGDSIPPVLQYAIAATCHQYRWVVRLHPCETDSVDLLAVQGAVRRLCGPRGGRITWQHPTERPLPAQLRETDVHLTFNSSAALEASYFGVQTGFVDQRRAVLRSGMSHLFDSGLADILPLSTSAIMAWLERAVAARRQRHWDVDTGWPEPLLRLFT